jgi:hypothetical protein
MDCGTLFALGQLPRIPFLRQWTEWGWQDHYDPMTRAHIFAGLLIFGPIGTAFGAFSGNDGQQVSPENH